VVGDGFLPNLRYRLNKRALSKATENTLVSRSVSRRDLFSGSAAVVATLSPGVKAAVSALSNESVQVELLKRGKARCAIVSTSFAPSWTLDTGLFAGSPSLTVEHQEKGTKVRLSNARFAGTLLTFNLEATIPHQASGTIQFSFTSCGKGKANFKTSARLDRWLKGEASSKGSIEQINLDALLGALTSDIKVEAIESGKIYYSATGELKAAAPMELSSSEIALQIKDLAISGQPRTDQTLVNGTNKTLTTIRATKRDSWNGEVALEAESGWVVNGSIDAFDTWRAECHENGQIATQFMGGGILSVSVPGTITLQATEPTLTMLGSNGRDLHFCSHLHEDGDWIHHEGVSHHAAPVPSQPFVLSKNQRGQLSGNPVLHSRTSGISMPDAMVSFRSAMVPNLTIVSQQQVQGITRGQGRPPIVQKPPIIQRPPVTKPPDIQKIDPNLKVSSQVWIPSIEVVRPQDFLNLVFEFANWHLVSSPGSPPYFERETPSRPGYIVVEFPPQSLGEQCYIAGHPFKYPVRTLLSGPTRLVFFVPSSIKTIKLSLTEDGGLLDWSQWSLSVAPAAFSTFSGKVSIDPSWQHPIQDLKIGASREFELYAERTPTAVDKLATLFRIQRSTTVDQGTKPIIQFQMVRQKSPNIIHYKPTVRDVRQADPTKVIPAIPTGRTGPVYRYNTNIEIPAMMQMSPDENAHFFHSRSVGANTGRNQRTALWHTRLGSFANVGGKSYRAEASDDGAWYYLEDAQGRMGPYQSSVPIHPNLRAIDATDYDSANPITADFTISHSQRIDIVNSMNYRTNNPTTDTPPFVAERLMLTSLGGFLKGSWHYPVPGAHLHNVTDWTQWTTLGRDQFVEIVEAGFLYPTGHAAVRVTTSQRVFTFVEGKTVSVLIQTSYIRVTNPVVNLESGIARSLGFSTIVCKTSKTPDVDSTGAMIRIFGSTEPYQFSMTGTDMDGNHVSWTQGSGFVLYTDGIQPQAKWNGLLAFPLTISGHAVAFAPSQSPSDGTVFPCHEFKMRSVPGTPNLNLGAPAFRPTMLSAKIRVPALEQYLPSSANLGLVEVKFAEGYKSSGFTGGAEVFLALNAPVSSPNGDGKKFGGMVNPSIKLDVISRKHGPIPNPNGNSISPSQYALITSEEFASTESMSMDPEIPKLLGVVSIWDLLPNSIDVGGNGSDVPKFKVAKVFADDKFGVVGSGNPNSPLIGAVSSFSWQPTLKDWAPASWSFSQKCFSKYKGTAQLRIDAAYYQITDPQGTSFPPGSSYFLKAGIYNFQVNACDQIHILVDKIEFNSQTGSNSGIKVDIDDIQFVNMLSFVGVLQSVLAPGKKGYHFSSSTPNSEILASTEPAPYELGIEPILDINGNGLTVGFSLSIPMLSIGVVSVMNIAVLSEMILPWFGDALTFRFAFCKRDAPFAVSVYGIAGGGFLGIELTPAGIKTIEGAIEFGACVSINLGVASGSISLMAGFYFKYEVSGGATLTGYVRLVGEVDVLGIISASIELYLGLNYNTSTHVLSGDAAISIRISLFCFHKTVTVHAHKEFAGSSGSAEINELWASTGAPPPLAERERTLFTKSVTNQQFNNYCSAFGGNS
jgi:hypothetical protein